MKEKKIRIYCDIDHSGLDLDNRILNEKIREKKIYRNKVSRKEIKENIAIKQKATNAYIENFFAGVI